MTRPDAPRRGPTVPAGALPAGPLRAGALRAGLRASLVTGLALLVAGCAGSLPPLPPTPSPTPVPTPTLPILQTRVQLEAALRLADIGLIDARQPYRPPEPPSLVSVTRAVFQAVLPDDPDHGDIVVYDLGSVAAATAAGRAMAGYLAGGPTRVEFPPDAQFVLRQLGSTLVFYTWSIANSPEPEAAKVGQVLATLGSGFSGSG